MKPKDIYLFPQDNPKGEKFQRLGGATLRDFIAVSAMNKLILMSTGTADLVKFCANSYKIADLMLEAREK